jgi:hypothetical protein
MLGATVPIAAVHGDDHPRTGEHDVRHPTRFGQDRNVNAVPEPKCVEFTT